MDRGLICHTRAASDRGWVVLCQGLELHRNKDGAGEREHWQEVLSKEVLEQYDSGVSYKELG